MISCSDYCITQIRYERIIPLYFNKMLSVLHNCKLSLWLQSGCGRRSTDIAYSNDHIFPLHCPLFFPSVRIKSISSSGWLYLLMMLCRASCVLMVLVPGYLHVGWLSNVSRSLASLNICMWRFFCFCFAFWSFASHCNWTTNSTLYILSFLSQPYPYLCILNIKKYI